MKKTYVVVATLVCGEDILGNDILGIYTNYMDAYNTMMDSHYGIIDNKESDCILEEADDHSAMVIYNGANGREKHLIVIKEIMIKQN